MKKFWKVTAALVVVVLIGFLAWSSVENKKLYVCQKDIFTHDLIIRNFTMAYSGDTVYFPYGCYLERATDREVNEVSVWLDCGKENLLSSVFSIEYMDTYPMFENQLLSNCKIKKDDTLELGIRYTVNGKEKTFVEKIKLDENRMESVNNHPQYRMADRFFWLE